MPQFDDRAFNRDLEVALSKVAEMFIYIDKELLQNPIIVEDSR